MSTLFDRVREMKRRNLYEKTAGTSLHRMCIYGRLWQFRENRAMLWQNDKKRKEKDDEK